MSSACCALCLCSATTRSAKAGYLRSALQTQVGTTLRANMATSCAQATYQNERWTGRKALRSVMARAICEHFGAASGLEAVLAHELEVVACGMCCMWDAADAVFVFWSSASFWSSFTRAGLLCCIAHMYVLVQAMRGLGLYLAPEHELSAPELELSLAP